MVSPAYSVGEPDTRQGNTDITFPSLKALVSDAMQDDMQDDSVYLPPCHADAAKPEDVYRFEDSILAVGKVPALQAVVPVRTGGARLCKAVLVL